jgi:hypothetical protein
MTSPPIEARSESAVVAAGTSHTVTRPAGVAGRLTIIVFGPDGNPVVTWPGGYTQFFTQDRGGTLSVFGAYHQDDGTEGTSIIVTTGTSVKSASFAHQLSGAENPATQAPEATTVDGSTGSSTPDPPAITPTGGSKDYTFITGINQDGEEADDDTWCNSPPTGYGNLIQKTSDIAGAATVNVSHAAADKAATTATEDPSTFSVDSIKTYVGYTIAIHPSAGAPPPAGIKTRRIIKTQARQRASRW